MTLVSRNDNLRSKSPVLVGVAGAVLLYLVLVSLVHYHADDGYIALRYVQNLLGGHGLVYNPGERVEGYNCFLWLVMLGAASWSLPSIPMHLVAEGIGIISGAATVVLMAVVAARRLDLRGWWAVVPSMLMAAHSGFVAWSTGGLETTFFALLLLLTAWAYLDWLDTGRRVWLPPLILAIASLTRPDAVPVFLAALTHAAFVTVRAHGARTASLLVLRWAGTYAAVVVPYFLWRYNYYGWLLPNTAYAKVGSGLAQYRRGVDYTLEYFSEYGLLFLLAPAVAAFLVRRDRPSFVLGWLLASHIAFVVLVGGDGLAQERFFVYSAPLLLLLATIGLRQMHAFLSARVSVAATPALVVAVLLAMATASRNVLAPVLLPERQSWFEPHSELRFPIVEGPRQYTWFDNYFVDRQAAAVRHLSGISPTGIIASTPAGAVAYFGKFQVIDMLGLNDEHIAHVPIESMGQGRAGHEKGDGAYVLSRRPDAILLGNVAVLPQPLDSALMSKKLILRSEKEIWATPEFHREYELVSVPLEPSGPFSWFTYARRRDGVFAASSRPQENMR